MSYDFNADDVLAMAEQMEINGGKILSNSRGKHK